MSKLTIKKELIERPYVLKCQREEPVEDQAIWYLKPLKSKEEEFLENNLGTMRNGDFSVKIGSQNRMALDIGLARVENLPYDDGTQVEITRSGMKVSDLYKKIDNVVMDRIPKEYRAELAGEILDGVTLDEEDLKN